MTEKIIPECERLGPDRKAVTINDNFTHSEMEYYKR